MFGIKTKIKLFFFKCRWKNKNCIPDSLFKRENVLIGNYSYGHLNVVNGDKAAKLKIGSFCSIAPKVTFLLDSEHKSNCLSTFPFSIKVLELDDMSYAKGDILIEDDVWIGHGATILSGVKIGQGSIIAAGAVVCKDVEAYSVVGGVPASLIKYRFNNEIRDFLMKLDYSLLTEDLIREHINELHMPIEKMDVCEINELFSWFPKKTNENK
jgi:acetyltransferase-like isoleucine patch superfamily enzyme